MGQKDQPITVDLFRNQISATERQITVMLFTYLSISLVKKYMSAFITRDVSAERIYVETSIVTVLSLNSAVCVVCQSSRHHAVLSHQEYMILLSLCLQFTV